MAGNNNYSLGPCILKITPLDGGEALDIIETLGDDDTKLSVTPEMFKIMTDQRLGPAVSKVANIEGTFTCSIPFNPEIASAISAEWEKGATTGFAIGGIGEEAVKFKLAIVPKGLTEGDEKALICPEATCEVSTEIDYKKQGLSKMILTWTLSSSEDESDSKGLGKVLYTGDYA